MESNKEVMPLEKYIEELKFYHNLYSTSGDEDSAEELLMYEQLISWLEELKRRRESEYPYYIADFVAVNKDGGNKSCLTTMK